MNNSVNCNAGGIGAKLTSALFGGVSVLALCWAVPATAQVTQPTTTDDATTIETVVVTGQRAAISSAIDIKRDADQIVDSIVADDAGKLPDRSITEVLQRVSGVTITHFNDLSNPDNYTVEGSGPTVRGLPGGTSTLNNGHNAFSANNGRQLLWGDVPSELMKAVDVYKTYTPDQIEGGLGGTINLRTHMPFDFDGFKANGVVSTSYGDLIKKDTPSASAMISDRWDTKWGEMGLLLDLSYDDENYRNDAIQVEPYFPHNNVLENYSLQNTGSGLEPVLNADPTTYWMPGGFDYHTSFIYHKRGGAYVAFQWRPTDSLSISATAFTSVNRQTEDGYDFAATSGEHNANITYTLNPTDSVRNSLGQQQLVAALSSPAPGKSDPLYHQYDANNNLVYSNAYYDTGFIHDPNLVWTPGMSSILARCSNANELCSTAATRTDASEGNSRTSDYNLGANWTPTDKLTIRTSLDFISSKATGRSLELEGDTIMAPYGIDLTGNYPRVVLSDPTTLENSSDYYWNNTMDHMYRNVGQESQAFFDADYAVDFGIVKHIKFGVRGDVRTEEDNDTGYNWQGLTPTWTSPQHWWSEPAAKSDITLYQFPDFFRGAVNLPGAAMFVDASKVEMFNANYFQQKYGNPSTPNAQWNPYQDRHYKTANVAGYAMVTFGDNNVLGMDMSGNAGARLVYVDNYASGYWNEYSNTIFQYTSTGPLYVTGESPVPVRGGRISWTLLPAFNLQFKPTDQFHIRFAGSITADQPNFAGIYGSSSVGVESGSNPIFTGFNFQGDNPHLKPQIGRNFDTSFEWYGADGGSDLYLSLFWKSIKHMTVPGYELDNLPWVIGTPVISSGTSCVTGSNGQCEMTNVQTVNEPTVTQTQLNSEKEARVRGFETGFTKYLDFDFVPHFLRGFGAQASFTYIDSKAPGGYSFDMYGNNIGAKLPVAGLSHYSYNATLMYDENPISFRLSYNWRSKYLMSASGWNTQGTYAASDNYISCPQNNTAAAGFGGNLVDGQCHYSLPVWSRSFGSLDVGLQYNIDEHFSLDIQSQNLLNTVAKTDMGYGTQEHGRSWFVSDRRVSMDLRVNY